jgi:hypothetical protein
MLEKRIRYICILSDATRIKKGGRKTGQAWLATPDPFFANFFLPTLLLPWIGLLFE